MNHQEVFNRVWEHFAAGAPPSYELRPDNCGNAEGVACLYRGPNNERCAIGALIPDEHYTPAIENHGPRDLLERHPETLASLNPGGVDDVNFLVLLQRCHDDASQEHHQENLTREQFTQRVLTHLRSLKEELCVSAPEATP